MYDEPERDLYFEEDHMSEEVSYDQPSAAPTPKVASVGIAGGVVTLVLLVGTLFGIQFEPDQVNQAVVGISAIVSLITFLAGYFKKDVKPLKAAKIIAEEK